MKLWHIIIKLIYCVVILLMKFYLKFLKNQGQNPFNESLRLLSNEYMNLRDSKNFVNKKKRLNVLIIV